MDKIILTQLDYNLQNLFIEKYEIHHYSSLFSALNIPINVNRGSNDTPLGSLRGNFRAFRKLLGPQVSENWIVCIICDCNADKCHPRLL